jgi:phage repressor protein C with HTH and peptisase S24 domain
LTYSLLELALPGRGGAAENSAAAEKSAAAENSAAAGRTAGLQIAPAGILLFDEEVNRLGVKMRRDWVRVGEDADLDPEDVELLAAFEGEIKRRAAELGAGEALRWLEESLSNVLRLSERRPVAEQNSGAGFEFLLHQLYRDWVPAVVQPYVTHIPRYALRSAAGPFGAEQDTEAALDPADWVEAPAGMRLSKDLFVAEVVGESMVPVIPSGSLCIFRKFGAGSRNGRMVLVEERSSGGARYTVKIYHSEKRGGASGAEEDGGWSHQRVWLEALNPAYPDIELNEDEDRYAVVAEYVRLLDS